ncbi:YcaO-like family protein [Micromonospora craniellae]|uniref:YcaO domain-containing protein n=1 Tax=Micromonospora craniellae TaxID=2294034 RepID=A0A372FYW4_9ACTN|nr:YcaO-like family protein [Micromonospora craniellae]QOC93441.1 YcaO-like family protein [Micromonospora craniellae]RFS45888.1 hypothetical protein D0Q02_14895 [Micromonospora craniellae]
MNRLLPGDTPLVKLHTDGTHRVAPLAETIDRVRRHFGPLGITRVADVTGLDRIGIPVVMVVRPNSRSLAVSQGKGTTLAAARASGLMEAAETHHAEHPPVPLRLATATDLARTADVIATGLPVPAHSGFHPDLPMLWAEGTDLTSGAPVWVPYETVHTDYTVTDLPGAGCFYATSNGLASGNHPREAVLHGLFEVVERDATVLWSLAAPETQDITRIDLATVDDPGCRRLLDDFDRADVLVAVWDQTSDLGLPAFSCEIIDRYANPLHVVPAAAGMGCHTDRGVALSRALTEAAQSRLTAITGSRDDQPPPAYARSHDLHALAGHRAVLADESPARRDFRQVPEIRHDTVDDDIADVCARLAKAGCDRVVAVDLSRPEFGIDVVRVVVPGLEHVDLDSAEVMIGPRARQAMA